MLLQARTGNGWFYWVSIISILLVLSLSANTAFADFPRLCRVISQNGYLPFPFSVRGRRLVYSQGVYVLMTLTALLLILFGGVTDRLIPLYAVGAFLAFTLSQAGMVQHWRRSKDPRSRHYMLINGVGAFATGVTVIVVLVAKFIDGAWITVLLIPILIALMLWIKRHFDETKDEVKGDQALDIADLCEPMVVVPVDRWSKITERAIRFGLSISTEVTALHVGNEEGEEDPLVRDWASWWRSRFERRSSRFRFW